MEIRLAQRDDLPALHGLVDLMWEGSAPDTLLPYLESEEAAIYVCVKDKSFIGLAACCLRHDYVEGCAFSPVGYLEGIAVLPDMQRQGIAKMLLSACEDFAKGLGCREFASDCAISNTDSLHFHLAVGFSEAGRIICFKKELKENEGAVHE